MEGEEVGRGNSLLRLDAGEPRSPVDGEVDVVAPQHVGLRGARAEGLEAVMAFRLHEGAAIAGLREVLEVRVVSQVTVSGCGTGMNFLAQDRRRFKASRGDLFLVRGAPLDQA